MLKTSLNDCTGGTIAPGFTYAYDLGGNRTQEQVPGTLVYAAHNELNQVTGLAPTAQTTSVRIAGTVDQASVVTANGQPATGGVAATSFAVNLPLAPGASTVTLVATTPAPESKTTTQHYAVPVGSSATVASLIYDPVGNLISQKGGTVGAEVTYAWDAANRLVRISKPGAVTEFVYDGFSRRVAEKYNGTIIKRWIWFNGAAQPAEERDASNAVTRRFYAGLGEQIGGANYYYTVDHLGSVRELTDSTGTVRARYAYDPYGRRTKLSGDLEPSFGYTGYYTHAASGLNLALYRAYDARLGRFISRDPIEEEGGINLYGYVYNNPVKWVDSLGLDVFFNQENESGGHAWTSIGGISPTCGNTYGAYPNGSLWGNNAIVQNPDSHAYDDDFSYDRYETTPEDEAALQKWIEDNYDINNENENKKNPVYRLGWEDCRSFNKRAKNQLEKIIKDRKGKVKKTSGQIPKKNGSP